MTDRIRDSFLEKQLELGLELAASCDLLELLPLGRRPVDRYIVRLGCTGLVRDPRGAVVEADRFEVGVRFPQDYLRRVHPAQVLAWLGPHETFHPNIMSPFICVGRLAPGTSLPDLIYQVFEIVTYTKVTMREDDALNKDACVWSRGNRARFPVDRRPLRRSVTGPLATAPAPSAAGPHSTPASRPAPSAAVVPSPGADR